MLREISTKMELSSRQLAYVTLENGSAVDGARPTDGINEVLLDGNREMKSVPGCLHSRDSLIERIWIISRLWPSVHAAQYCTNLAL